MEIKYTMELLQPVTTASMGIIGKDINVTVKVDKGGKPVFTGKQMKGVLRKTVKNFKAALENKEEAEEFIKKYFGTEGSDIVEDRKLKIRFSNLKVSSEFNETKIDSRYGIRIDRKTRTTEDNSLFNYEFLNKGLIFEGKIEIDDSIKEEDLKFILASLEHVDFIGGLKSRGLGKVKIKLEQDRDEILNELRNKKNQTNKNISISENIMESYSYTLELREDIILKEEEKGNNISVRDSIQGSTLRGAVIAYFVKNGVELEKLIKIEASDALEVGKKIKLSSSFETKYPIGKEKVKVDKVIHDKISIPDGDRNVKLERSSLTMMDEKINEINIGIDETTKSVKETMLFNTEVILGKRKILKGDFKAPKGLIEKKKKYKIFIGKMKSKGFGKAEILFEDYNAEKIESIKERIENLNKCRDVKKEIRDEFLITFDLMSDIVLPFNELHDVGEQFKILAGLDEKIKFNLEKSFINIKKMGGYNIINQWRKADELIICRGSVITYFVPNYTEILERLNNIESEGLGLRKNEGFGRIRICSARGEE